MNKLQYLKGVGEKRAQLFAKLGVDSVDALLRYYPRGYTDYKNQVGITECELETTVCVKATIVTPVEERSPRRGMTIFRFVAADSTGEMTVTLFNQKYLAARLHMGSTYLFYGKMGGTPFFREMASPEIHEEAFAGIHPIYPACEGLPSSTIAKIVKTALPNEIDDPIPHTLIEKYKLCPLSYALKNIHFPASAEALAAARRRLMFEELFLLQTGLAVMRTKRGGVAGLQLSKDYSEEFSSLLPFSLTGAQKRVISECIDDMMSGKRMNRLIQGDVGSGKTAVCAALVYTVCKNGFQSALMAPTEILAEQHYATLKKMFGDSLRVELLTGSVSKAKKERIKAAIAAGEVDVAVGTHALIVDDVQFLRPGLVITDEQHRFGVAQRQRLASKGMPHTLVMSATPIPRTLALIIYGDLDVSIIDELPVGRQTVESYAVGSVMHERIYNFIKKELDHGRQAYIICPLVEEGESGLTSAEEYFERLKDGAFFNYRLGLLHGKMPAKEKDAVMKRFAENEVQLLIATTVVEVGVDVPNATVLVIENAERFGLSQLHQLRGRVGRGQHKSTCILISDDRGDVTKGRLSTLCRTTNGFEIADADLKARGPGDFLGNRQHGLPELKIADMQADIAAMRIAGEEARAIVADDPTLSQFPILKAAVAMLFSTAYRL